MKFRIAGLLGVVAATLMLVGCERAVETSATVPEESAAKPADAAAAAPEESAAAPEAASAALPKESAKAGIMRPADWSDVLGKFGVITSNPCLEHGERHGQPGHCHLDVVAGTTYPPRTLTLTRTANLYTATFVAEDPKLAGENLTCPGLEYDAQTGWLRGNCLVAHAGKADPETHYFEFELENFVRGVWKYKITFRFSDKMRKAGEPPPIHNGGGHAHVPGG